ncbi:MAG: phosphoribosylaminoimidazolesuccinocarboxamide synthase [Candidatus Omnitrophica bacterium]|nr:phosphoribosylaminoimidazolesuccinocarboxamide synthase [Candidatus Omnitrophota bacterium]
MRTKTVWESNLPLPLAGRGKVRDIYQVGDDQLLIVASDRLSAFDVILPNPIPLKGKVLTQISVFWFHFFKEVMPHHLITSDVSKMNLPKNMTEEFGEHLEGRSMLVKKTKPFLVECVVRGYITGSGWKDYQKTGHVCGYRLPKGLKQCDKLPKPLFTPATKAASGHDENISVKQAAKIVGGKNAERLGTASIDLYQKGADYADSKGIIVADTKFEFGVPLTLTLSPRGRGEGEGMILIDEAITPDSSRFWPKKTYEPGHDQPSFDKQIVRNYLLKIQWNQKPPAPKLPEEIVEKTSAAYCEIYEKLTGKKVS